MHVATRKLKQSCMLLIRLRQKMLIKEIYIATVDKNCSMHMSAVTQIVRGEVCLVPKLKSSHRGAKLRSSFQLKWLSPKVQSISNTHTHAHPIKRRQMFDVPSSIALSHLSINCLLAWYESKIIARTLQPKEAYVYVSIMSQLHLTIYFVPVYPYIIQFIASSTMQEPTDLA